MDERIAQRAVVAEREAPLPEGPNKSKFTTHGTGNEVDKILKGLCSVDAHRVTIGECLLPEVVHYAWVSYWDATKDFKW